MIEVLDPCPEHHSEEFWDLLLEDNDNPFLQKLRWSYLLQQPLLMNL